MALWGLALVLCPALRADHAVIWTETNTHRIKTEVGDGKVIGHWEFLRKSPVSLYRPPSPPPARLTDYAVSSKVGIREGTRLSEDTANFHELPLETRTCLWNLYLVLEAMKRYGATRGFDPNKFHFKQLVPQFLDGLPADPGWGTSPRLQPWGARYIHAASACVVDQTKKSYEISCDRHGDVGWCSFDLSETGGPPHAESEVTFVVRRSAMSKECAQIGGCAAERCGHLQEIVLNALIRQDTQDFLRFSETNSKDGAGSWLEGPASWTRGPMKGPIPWSTIIGSRHYRLDEIPVLPGLDEEPGRAPHSLESFFFERGEDYWTRAVHCTVHPRRTKPDQE